MFRAAIRFPITDGAIVSVLRAGLVARWGSSGLVVQGKLPDAKVRRMVTVRNDSGPQEERISRRRYGVNVWADDPVDAENMALDVLAILQTMATGFPIVSADSFSGPFEVSDDPQMTVANKNLTHFYCAFRASVKASTFI